MNSAIIRPSHRTTASCRRNQRGLRDAGGPTVGDEQHDIPQTQSYAPLLALDVSVRNALKAWCDKSEIAGEVWPFLVSQIRAHASAHKARTVFCVDGTMDRL
ncbi:hypothetical protein KOW79_004873 [Hemibagrus wyckioides]|uniref:Uncharacterized protein n=1 Tax=Hemibagrus wyckioides TaxID=337641 RepID=A0A9D3ST35_9TELE|nr:hypothetical protein KOW79_004873 [Hemibagrus wyckioides]